MNAIHRSILLLLTVHHLFTTAGQACINEYHVNKKGDHTSAYEGLPIFYRGFDVKPVKEFLSRYDLANTGQYNHSVQSDIAANLIKLGLYKEAYAILVPLSLKHPREYNIIINLGTLYELLGKNDSALLYIKKGLVLNDSSHRGSEWFHVKLLETKIRMAGSADWLMKNRVLNLRKPGRSAVDTIRAIEYQLQERIPFTAVPDLLLAKVLDEFGDYLADAVSVKSAYIIYKIAGEYDSAGLLNTGQKAKELAPLLQEEALLLPDHWYWFRRPDGWENKVAEYTADILQALVSGKKPAPAPTKKGVPPWLPLAIAATAGLAVLVLLFVAKKRKQAT